ncbi:SGNH/GDSL hydrolase family protein [Candidatus Daviesbacteria bacterium]|nr:SGNH/GDSL hydrolase family protein [Candidatus Daviesbacteria bacterium]
MRTLVISILLLGSFLSFNISDSFLDQIFNTFFANQPSAPVKITKSYTLALVGDSMTESLGTADGLRDSLRGYYPGKEFGILNFGIGSSSILSVPDRLKKESKRGSEILPPVLETKPDIIFLESFGNNPLSEFSLEEGLKKQTDTLEQIVAIIKKNAPKAKLVFVATIAPSEQKYGTGAVKLFPEQKKQWVAERVAYIKNHIEFAKSHNIPLVNIYEKSLNNRGDGDTAYLNSSDFIHPSARGIEFISQQVAEFVFQQKLIGD